MSALRVPPLGRVAAAARSAAVGAWLGRNGMVLRHRALDFAPFEPALAAIPPTRHDALAALTAGASIRDVTRMLDEGALTAVELTLFFLRRVGDLDGHLQSVVQLNPHALAEAAAADGRRRLGTPAGPLDGIPVLVKDNIETAVPLRTAVGSMAIADHQAATDAPVVQRLRAAGAVVLGTANLSELAGAMIRTPGVSAVGGRTVNPRGDAYSPGGRAADRRSPWRPGCAWRPSAPRRRGRS